MASAGKHIRTTPIAMAIALCASGLCSAQDVIWDYGPKTGELYRCWTNNSDRYNYAEDVLFDDFVELIGIDMWTCESAPLGALQVRLFVDNGYQEPGPEVARWITAPSRYEFDGTYNGTDLYKVGIDFKPFELRGGVQYWIGVSGHGWELGHALVRWPGNSYIAGFYGDAFDRIYFDRGDLMFQLRGRFVFPPFELSLEGDCPGSMTASIIGATPGGPVALLRGQRGGETTIPNGPCAGAVVPLGNAMLVETLTADAEGNAEFAFELPGGCGTIAFAALDLTTCAVTEAARTYARPELYFGARIALTEGLADFNQSLCCNRTVPPCHDEGGLHFTRAHRGCDGPIFGGLPYCGGDGTPSLYMGGSQDMMKVVRLDGADFDAIEFNAGDGAVNHCYDNLWIRAYLDGRVIADYLVDMPRSQIVGLVGGEFDELRIGGYSSESVRDLAYETRNERAHQSLALDNVRIGTIHAWPSLTLSGTCPGEMAASISGATPRGTVALIFGQRAGQTTIPTGPCAGTLLPISGGVQLVSTTRADGHGNAAIAGTVPPSACGGRLVVLDVATCTTSNVVRIE